MKFPGNLESSIYGKPKARYTDLFVPPKTTQFLVKGKSIMVGNFASVPGT